MSWRGWVLLAVALGGCRTERVDWDAFEERGQVVDALPAFEAFNSEHYWSAGSTQLQIQEGRTLFGAHKRLTVTVHGAQGNATPFVVDTGSIATTLSTTAPLMREGVISRKHRYRVLQGNVGEGHMGQVARMRMGTMQLQDVLVALDPAPHSLNNPSNIIGIRHIWNTQLAHDRGRWSISTFSQAKPASEPGWDRVAFVPGYPLVSVRTPAGRDAYALIDTGAPRSFAVRPFSTGVYTLPTVDGRTALRIRAEDDVDWKGLQIDGKRIELLIGMDTLASRSWRMTFRSNTWSFAPGR